MQKYEIIIGLEVHAQLLTRTKAYSKEAFEYGGLPNTQTSAITLAHPGALPQSNGKVVEHAIRMGLACQSTITEYNYYDRKNYFYPDLPKGYQITQDKTPICRGGQIEILTKNDGPKTIHITRIHMEEDAGKSIHLAGETETLIDLNRAGVPLIEIVSEPEIRNAEQAYLYLIEIRKLLQYLDICDGNMEEGSLRCDLNISLRPYNQAEFGAKVEVKNMNSFRNVQRAIEIETIRQADMLDNGKIISSETRMFDATTNQTYSLRSKENLNDYRYFPEPDLQPIIISTQYLSDIQTKMPALPNQLYEKFTQKYDLGQYDAGLLTEDKQTALYFDALCIHTHHYKQAANWIIGTVKSFLNENALEIADLSLNPERLAQIINLTQEGKISQSAASQTLFFDMVSNQKTALESAKDLNLIQERDQDTLLAIIDTVLGQLENKVLEYKQGKKGLLSLFVGQVMKASGGKADPKLTSELIEKKLENLD